MPASASRIQVGSGERRLLLLLSALVAFGPLSIDMYLPSLPAIAADLGASDAQVQRSISGFLVGFCVGMLFYGPLSDRFGRRRCCWPVSPCTCSAAWPARWPTARGNWSC